MGVLADIEFPNVASLFGYILFALNWVQVFEGTVPIIWFTLLIFQYKHPSLWIKIKCEIWNINEIKNYQISSGILNIKTLKFAYNMSVSQPQPFSTSQVFPPSQFGPIVWIYVNTGPKSTDPKHNKDIKTKVFKEA